jgi:Tfp pilus assembly protein PilX
MMPACRFPRRPVPSRQGGAILFIALIVLVAMTLAGIAMIRSVDTSLGIAGNMAFRQSSLQGADKGVQAAVAWLAANSSGTALQSSNPGLGYFSATAASEAPGYWFNINNWGSSVALPNESGQVGNPDAAGNVVRYVIHRMCSCADVAYNAACGGGGGSNNCGLYFPVSGGAAGGSMTVGAPVFIGIPQIYYRITARVDGPRNTVSVVQVTVLIQV